MSGSESRANVATERPAPYMRQLCKHFGHKNDADFGDSSAWIRFPYGLCEMEVGDGALLITVSAEKTEDCERLEGVIGSHLERFGRRDALSVSWQ
jgi:uncharacterized protein